MLELGLKLTAIVLAPAILIALVWRFSPLAHAPNRPTWRRCQLTIWAVMLVGIALFVIWPVWLAPPYFQSTSLIYLGLIALWIPVCIVCVFLRPTGMKPASIFVLFVVGYLAAVITLVLTPERLSTSAFVPSDCQQATPAQGQARYTCKHDFLGLISGYDQYILEGSEGSPFVWLSSKQHGDYPSP